MLNVETAITVRAPVTTVRDLYADYAGPPSSRRSRACGWLISAARPPYSTSTMSKVM
jgi:hypothetical protein